MRFHPLLTTLCLAIALISGGLGTHAMASNQDGASSGESQDSAQQGGQALDDDALQEKYGITPGALKRDDPASEDENGNEDQTSNAAGQAPESDNEQRAEQGPAEEQEGNSGDAVSNGTEDEEGNDPTEKAQNKD